MADLNRIPKDIRKLVEPYLIAGAQLQPGKKHAKIVMPNNRRMPLPGSPSEPRGLANLASQLRRLAAM